MNKNEKNENIDLITGDVKPAIRKLAIPMMLSMLLVMAYNLADSIWVAGLGADALAALGFITPVFTLMVGIGNGIGAGANSLIARAIGAKNKQRADNGGIHSIFLSFIASIIITIVLLLLLRPIMIMMGATGASLEQAMTYGNLVFIGMFLFNLSAVLSSILRSEGDVKRATYVMAISAVINIVIDPIFIYVFNMGISGAAWCTLLAVVIANSIMGYWLFIKKDTYLSLEMKNFKYSKDIMIDMLKVALPSSVETLFMSISSTLINMLLVTVAATSAVAVYTAGWRIVSMAIIPPIGLSTALITVAGAAYGARRFDRMLEGMQYSIKLGIIMSVIIGVLIIIFAPQIAGIFSYGSSAGLGPAITVALQVLSVYSIFVPLGIMPVAIFQGAGNGFLSLAMTTQRSLILFVVCAWIFGLVLGLGAMGVYWGVVVGGTIGCFIAYAAARYYIKRLERYNTPTPSQ